VFGDVEENMRLLMLALLMGLSGCASERSYRPMEGFVPDAQTAERIAEAIWKPVYGAKVINEQRPFETRLEGRVWYVSGSLPPPGKGWVMVGGTAEAEIDRFTGKILRMSHSK
jgi:hypothetical protein